MATKKTTYKTASRTSPKGGRRGCLCENNTYSLKCCDGSLQAQGIGNITGVRSTETFFILQENGYRILQENNNKILLENG